MAPLYAALTARLINLYGLEQVQNDFRNGGYYKAFSFYDITLGNNGEFFAQEGWDPVTGMGSFKNYTPSVEYYDDSPNYWMWVIPWIDK